MDSKLRKLKNLLLFGTIIMFIAGICMINTSGLSFLSRVIIEILISIAFLISSYYEEKEVNLKNESILSYFLGFISLIIAYAKIGTFGLFGEFFSIGGDGSKIFLASIFLLCFIFSLISLVKYKYFILRLMEYISLIGTLFFIVLYFGVNEVYIFIVISCIILIANLFKNNKEYIWIGLILGLSLIPYYFESEQIIISLLYLVNFIDLFVICKKSNNNFIPLIIILISNFIFSFNLNVGIYEYIVYISIISLLEILMHLFKIYKNNDNYIIKILINCSYLVFILETIFNFNNNLLLIILPIIILVISLIDIYLFKDKNEKYLLIFKIIFLIYYLILLFNIDKYISKYVILLAIDIIISINYLLNKKNKLNNLYLISLLIINFISLYMLYKCNYYNYEGILLLVNIGLNSYLISNIENIENNNFLSFIYYFTLSLLVLVSFDFNLIYEIVSALLLIEFMYLFQDRKNKLIVSIIIFIYFLCNIIESLNFDYYIAKMFVEAIIVFGYIAIVYISSNSNKESLYTTGMLIISIIFILLYDSNEIKMVSAIEMLVLLLYGLKKDYKYSYISSFIILVLLLIDLLLSINLPIVIFFLVISCAIIIIVPIMIEKYLKEVKKNGNKKIENIEVNEIHYCPECGTKVLKDFKHCPNCGYKIR